MTTPPRTNADRPSSAASRHWSGHLVALLVGAGVVLLALGVITARTLGTLNEGADWVLHTELVELQLGDLLQTLTDIETAERGYAVSQNPRFLEPYEQAAPRLDRELAGLGELIADNPTQRPPIAELRALAHRRLEHAESVIAATKRGDVAAAQSLISGGVGKAIMDDSRQLIARMKSEEARLLLLRHVSDEQSRRTAARAEWVTVGVGLLLIGLVAYLTSRHGARLRRAEAELALTLRSIGDAVISTDASGTVRFVNGVAERLTGWSEREARGRALDAVFRIVHELTRETVESPVAKVLRDGGVVDLANHTVLLARGGGEVAIEDSGAPILGPDGRIDGVVLVFRDATLTRVGQRALQASEARFRAAVSAVQGVLWTNSADGEMRGEQPAWAELTGQAFDEYQGFGWSKAVHPDDAQPTIDAWLDAWRARRRFQFEHRVRRADGEWRRFLICAIPVTDAAGELVEWVGVHTDVTERREAEEALRESEARFRAIQETSIDGFMVLESVRDSDGEIVDFRWLHANEAAERIVGRPRTWFVGRRLLQEMPGNREEGLFDEYVTVVNTGTPFTREFEYRHEGIDAYLRLVAAKSGDGFAVSFADLTERRRAEEAVRASQQRFVALADAMPQLVWINDADGRYEYLNNRWFSYTGLTENEFRNAGGWNRALHPEDTERSDALWAASLTTGSPYEVELRLRRHDGAFRWFLCRATPDRDADGRIVRWHGTCTDIDATKRTEETLRAAQTALRDADERKDIFLATLSHELRNPLAPIRTAARVLESQTLTPEALALSRSIISRQVQHMATLLDDLMDVSRITRGVLLLRKEYVDLRTVLETAIEAARPLIDAKHHRLELDWPMVPIQVDVDPTRLAQVATNLLTNAAKYTDPEGQITFGTRIDGGTVVIFVRDTGIGLAADTLTRVFDMFTQVEPDKQRGEGGLGIGLALVKGLVDLHGGRVEARSAGLNKGSEFLVFLPSAVVAARESLPLDSVARGSQQRPHRVLIADDNRDAADGLAMLLRQSGHHVHVAYMGPDAFNVAAAERPDVCVMDIGMPGMDGYEVARRIRRQAWGVQMTLIAVTGWGQEDDKSEARAAGFDHHLTKPMDLESLEQILSSSIVRPDGAKRT